MKSLKLNKINKNQLSAEQMKSVCGGGCSYCKCSCYWANQGGSSAIDNGVANMQGGLESARGDIKMIVLQETVFDP